MIHLPPEKYGLARTAIEDVSINSLLARSVVENHVHGRIQVEDESDPRIFHVLHPYGMSLLFGEISRDFLRSDFLDYLTGRSSKRTGREYLQVFPTVAEKDIDELLGDDLCVSDNSTTGCRVVKHERVNFRFNPYKFSEYMNNTDLEQYCFQRVDEQLFNNFTGSVIPRKFWNNSHDFSDRGVGYALMIDGCAAAVSFSACLNNSMLELGIETAQEYRRNGFAAVVSARLIQYCVESGLEPVWACMGTNYGSYNLAVKLGFEPAAFLPFYECM